MRFLETSKYELVHIHVKAVIISCIVPTPPSISQQKQHRSTNHNSSVADNKNRCKELNCGASFLKSKVLQILRIFLIVFFGFIHFIGEYLLTT